MIHFTYGHNMTVFTVHQQLILKGKNLHYFYTKLSFFPPKSSQVV